MNKTLTEENKQRIEKYPKLKWCVEHQSNDYELDAVTVYVRMLNIDEPETFGWDEEIAEDFYTWGHNSRYCNVFEPMLEDNFNEYLSIIMYIVEDLYGGKEDFINDKELFGHDKK